MCLVTLIEGTFLTFPLAVVAGESVLDRVRKHLILRAGIRRNNPPHSFINDEGQWVGFDLDIAQAVADHLGAKLKKVPVDELTRFSFLQTGTIDVAVASMSHTWKREAQIDFSQTYFWSVQSFLVRRDRISNYEELIDKKLGMSRGSHAIGNWQEWLTAHGYPRRDDQIVKFTSKQAAVAAVKSGAIAGFAEDYTQLINFARGDDELIVLTDSYVGVKQDGLGIVENDSRMRDALNHALQEIERSGRYAKIYDKWFGPGSGTPIPQVQRIELWPNG